LDAVDQARRLREEAKNALEAFIYATRNRMTYESEDVEVRLRHSHGM
jgi:hypothetical protein